MSRHGQFDEGFNVVQPTMCGDELLKGPIQNNNQILPAAIKNSRNALNSEGLIVTATVVVTRNKNKVIEQFIFDLFGIRRLRPFCF